MVVATAGRAHVGPGQAHPLVARGLEHHALEQQAVLLLDLGAFADRPAGGVDPLREVVANLLQVSQAEHPRTAVRRHREIDPGAWIGGDKSVGELALERGDLLAQGPSRRSLVDLDNQRKASVDDVATARDLLLENLHHTPLRCARF